jgi:hypothetical protein
MKKVIFAIILIAFISSSICAQDSSTPPKIGWFVTPDVGVMFLGGSVGKSVGTSFGIKLWKNRLKVGVLAYGRPGPINSATFETTPYQNQTYKGQSKLKLRSDWGVIGGFIAPSFKVGKTEIDIPIAYGLGIGGFYLHGDDRKTPDGSRVSVWEDKLFNGEDATAGTVTDIGARVFFPTKINGVRYGMGVHYTMVSGWKPFADPSGDLYNNRFRVSLLADFGSF